MALAASTCQMVNVTKPCNEEYLNVYVEVGTIQDDRMGTKVVHKMCMFSKTILRWAPDQQYKGAARALSICANRAHPSNSAHIGSGQ